MLLRAVSSRSRRYSLLVRKMPSDPLQNLVSAKQLKAEPPDRKEFEKLVRVVLLGRRVDHPALFAQVFARRAAAVLAVVAAQRRSQLFHRRVHHTGLSKSRWFISNLLLLRPARNNAAGAARVLQ